MNRTRQIREHKPYARGDLIVYVLIVALIVALFCIYLGRQTQEADGITVEVHGEVVYRYEFGSGGTISAGWEDRVSEERGDVLQVRIETASGHNVIAIDEAARTVRIQDADCSRQKDCTHMQAIGEGRGVIVSIPHGLTVTSLQGEDLSRPGIG